MSTSAASAFADDPATGVRVTLVCAPASSPTVKVSKNGNSMEPFTVSGSGYLVNGAQTTTTVAGSAISVSTPAFGFVRAIGFSPSDFFEVATAPSSGLAITSGRLLIDRSVIVASGSTTAFASKTSVLDYRFASTASTCSGAAQLTPSS